MAFLVTLHEFVRWLVLIAGLIGLVDGFLALFRGAMGDGPLARTLPAAFLGLLDLQLLIGALLLFLVPGAWPRFLPHAVVMVIAIASAHVLRVRTRKAPPEAAPRAVFLLYLVPLILVLVGMALVRSGAGA